MTLAKTAAAVLAIAVLVLSIIGEKPPPVQAQPSAVRLGINGTTEQYAHLGQLGLPVSVMAIWESWSSDSSPRSILDEAAAIGATPFIIWQPMVASNSKSAFYSTPKIAAGKFDTYITLWATTIKEYEAPVYIRFAHEMNGSWYPWSASGSHSYIAAWRHVWSIFHKVGARNARFLWSPDGIIGHEQSAWQKEVSKWFPGERYVDYVGMSTVMFLATAKYGINYYFNRLDFLKEHFRKPMILPEMKVFQGARYSWLEELRHKLAQRRWIKMLLWSESASTAQALGEFRTGQMNWSLAKDPRARHLLRAAVRTR